MASGRPAFGSRFNTGNIEPALLARGFHYGTAPNSVVIGWNGGHAAVTLPDGTPVSSGESGSGVRIGGGGAFQPQFNHHMYLPVQADTMNTDPAVPPAADPHGAPISGDVAGDVVVIDIANTATDAIAPEAIAPEAIAPEAVVPEAVAPEAVAPEVVVPEVVAQPEVEAEQVPA